MEEHNKVVVLVSSCLLGEPVRYNGTSGKLDEQVLDLLFQSYKVVAVCPEIEAGLGVPRSPVEIIGGVGEDVFSGSARVEDRRGNDFTVQFISGAERVLELCREKRVQVAILTENSPSCGSSRVYDGSFTGKKIPGSGVITALLRQHGVAVFSQKNLVEAFRYLETLQKAGAR